MSTSDDEPEVVDDQPRGTMFLLLCFLGLIALMWGWMYLLLWRQGG